MAGMLYADPGDPVLSVGTDRPDALYRKGEAATFNIRLEQDGKPLDAEVQWTLLKNGANEKKEGVVTLHEGMACITGTLDEAGFLPCAVKCEINGKKLDAEAAAGFDPLKIVASMPVPDDFDAFWNEKKKQLAAVPMKVQLTQVESTRPNVEVFDVQADCLGAPVSGYLGRPVGAKPKSLPALLSLHGAGVVSSDKGQAIHWAGMGMLALDINAHGLPNGKPVEFYETLKEGDLKSYAFIGCESRETNYFLGMYLRALRALDVLASQPEWDGHTLIVYGASQGGQQAIAAAALDSRVSLLVAGVPAMSDPNGTTIGRIDGAFFVVSRKPGANGGFSPEVVESARYYTGANFASRVKVPTQFTVGFIDHSCPPTLVYSAYNKIATADKKIHNGTTSGHALSEESRAIMQSAVSTHVKEQRGTQ